MRWTSLFILSALVALSAGCASAYSRAAKEDTPAAYRAFLRDNPDSPEEEAAKARLEDLEFAAAERAHTVLAYKRFLEEFPEGDKASAAIALIETLRWNAAQVQGTSEVLQLFLREHPNGAHHQDAAARLKRLEEESRARETEPRRLKEALVAAPEAERSRLSDRLDDFSFAAAAKEGSGALLAYLTDFPAGKHREEAKTTLLTRNLEGLLFSGLLAEAKAEHDRSPLGPKVPDWGRRWAAAQNEEAAVKTAHEQLPGMLPDYYLRTVPDLTRALEAPDPLDRWQAAEELGAQVTVAALDPLLRALHVSKNPRVRQAAFASLQELTRVLPPAVTEHELATRLASQRASANSPEGHALIASLLELLGRGEEAATQYQLAFDAKLPDPLVLWRWMELRRSQGKPFSSAVAARQLGLWGRSVLEELGPEAGSGHLSLPGVRQLCAVAHFVRLAHTGLEAAKSAEREFPEDVAGFLRDSDELRRLAEARLRDAELALLTQQPQSRACDDRQVAVRLEDAVQLRRRVLEDMPRKLPRAAPALLKRASEKDPSAYIRKQAAADLARGPH